MHLKCTVPRREPVFASVCLCPLALTHCSRSPALHSSCRPSRREHVDTALARVLFYARSPRSRRCTMPNPHGGRGKLDVSYLLNDTTNAASRNSRTTTAPRAASAAAHAAAAARLGLSAAEYRLQRNTCPQCGHCFAQSADLRKHLRTVHEGLRPFRCDLCDKSFGEKGNLRKHRRSVHFNERPFACTTCSAAFAFKDGLARHIKLVHDNARPFTCRCGASYKQVSQLRRHQDTCVAASTKPARSMSSAHPDARR